MENRILSDMTVKPRCEKCDRALKVLYERHGESAVFRPAAYRCPKCGKLFDSKEIKEE